MKINNRYNEYSGISKFRIQKGTQNTCHSSSNISFKGDVLRVVEGKTSKYRNILEIADCIDKVLGKSEGNFASKIKKAGIKISDTATAINDESFAEAFFSTLKYPFTDMPFELMKWFANILKKAKATSSVGDKILNNNFIKSRLAKIDAKKNYTFVAKALEQFCNAEKFYPGNLEKLTEEFNKMSAGKITQKARAYMPRDERTLNRLVTGGIGAVYSAMDIHNISMLEKNDKKSAKKAGNDRRQQEMRRVGLSALLTFFTLGVFDKYTKGNYILNALIIAGSTLLSEVVSRISKHKSLLPLSPERAQKIAQKNKINQNDKSKNTNTKPSPVKNAMNRLENNDTQGLYNDFINPKTNKKHQNEKSNQNNKNKKLYVLPIIASAFGICSLAYLTSRYFKGEYRQKKAIDDFVSTNMNKLITYLDTADDTLLTEDMIKHFNKLSKEKKGILDIIKNKITKHDIKINIESIEKELDELLKSPASKDIASVISEYKRQAYFLKSNTGLKTYFQNVTNTVPNAIYEGVTRIFKTLYTILSAPARLTCHLLEKKFEGNVKVFKDANNLFGTQDKDRLISNYQKQLAELDSLFKRYKNSDDKYEKISKIINTHTHSFEEAAETGELANFSRTLVTLIASYFYVNDFRNTVLIESEGQNTQRAREVMNDSISYKLCNFFFNGFLMNIFNSVFKGTLNGSLLGATAVAAATEMTNEFAIRKTISRPMKPLDSREAIIEFEQSQANRKGFAGWWTRTFKKFTGQKSLTEKYESQKAKKN